MSYGGHPSVTNRPFLGKIAHVSRFNRYLSVAEIHTMQFHRKPMEGCVLFNEYGFNGTGAQVCFAGSALSGTVSGATLSDHVPIRPVFCASVDDYSYKISAGAFTIAAAGGSYALSGTAAGLFAGRKVDAGAGSYALSGAAASLLAGRKLAVNSGSYAISGTAAGLRAARLLSAGGGSYVITGQDVTLIYTPGGGSFVLSAASGSYSITGGAANLRAARLIAEGAGVYAISGSAANLRAGRKVTAQGGSYAVSGQNIATLANRIIPLAGGGYLITGSSITLVPPVGSTQPGHVTARVYEAHHVRARISKGSNP
jgi:hypothetical protein